MWEIRVLDSKITNPNTRNEQNFGTLEEIASEIEKLTAIKSEGSIEERSP